DCRFVGSCSPPICFPWWMVPDRAPETRSGGPPPPRLHRHGWPRLAAARTPHAELCERQQILGSGRGHHEVQVPSVLPPPDVAGSERRRVHFAAVDDVLAFLGERPRRLPRYEERDMASIAGIEDLGGGAPGHGDD